jgi:hypothetical protein
MGLTLRQTEQQLAELARIAEQEEEAAWRATFQPCAYLVGRAERPSSICIYGLSGGADRWFKFSLISQNRRSRLRRRRSPSFEERPVSHFGVRQRASS